MIFFTCSKRTLTDQTVKVVKLTIFLLTAAFLQVSAIGTAQSISFSGKNVSLKTVFTSIEKQTGYVFFYNNKNKEIESSKNLTLDFRNVNLEEALRIILKGLPLSYVIKGKTIFIKENSLTVISEQPQKDPFTPIDFRGKVVNEHGEPMAGVTILVKGTAIGTKTDSQGRFTLSNVTNNAVLEFSYVGYTAINYKVSGDKNEISITLIPKINELNDVVMVGYGTSRRKDLTGSVASVDINEIKNTPFTSIDQALSGKAAGVQVTQADGSPGGIARIRIRGGVSLIGGNDPLYIIDGVQVPVNNRYIQAAADVLNPVERLGSDVNYYSNAVGGSFARGLNTLAGLNINDIETIDILKDASATAIYGSRAANGVVIITTKKGKKNEKPVLEANYYSGFSKAITEKLLNADQYKAVMLKGAQNLNAWQADQGLPADPMANNIINNPDFLGTAKTNWMDLVTRTGVTQNADVSIRGGGTGTRYYTSVAYNKQTGTLLGTDFSRIAGKINLDNEITDKIRLITNLDFGFTKNNITNGIYASALYAPPTLSPYNADGTPAIFDNLSLGIPLVTSIQNPMALIQGKNTSKTALWLGSLGLEYDILKSLKFRSTVSVNYSNYNQLNYIPSTVMIASNRNSVSSNGGVATQASSRQSDVFYENTLTWDKSFNKDHRLTWLVGTSWQQTNLETFSASGQGFPDDHFLNGLSSAAVALPAQNSEAKSSLLSFYTRANYAFKERYLLTVTARSDESSKFPKSNRTSYFPSFGVAWRANEESFLKPAKWLDELKFRASAGYTGTQNLGNNLFYTLYTPGSYAATNALVPTQLGNDNIKWERTLQKDAGIDFSLFNGRFRGALGYYDKYTSGLLMALNVAGSSGYNTALVNLADIQNRGLEIDLRVDVIRKKDFTWNFAANINGNRAIVKNINNDLQNPLEPAQADPFFQQQVIGNTVLREGKSFGLIYGYVYKGIVKTQKQLDELKANNFFYQVGALPHVGFGYPIYALEDTGTYKGFYKRDVIGSAQPKFYGGITNTVSYKRLSLIFLLSYSYGGDLLYLPEVKSFGLIDRANRNTRILLPSYSAATPDANRPALLLGENNTFYTGASSADVFDASYIKLKSITLNYQLPEKLLNKVHLHSAMLYLSGANLFTITSYPGPDPEVSNDPYSLINGYTDAATYPTMRQFTIGARVGF